MKKYNGDSYKEAIIEVVCERYRVKFNNLYKLNKKRDRPIVKTRQVIMYFLDVFTNMTTSEIASIFNKNHSTFIHTLKVVNNMMVTNKQFYREMSELSIIIEFRLKNMEILQSGNLHDSIKKIFDAALTVGDLRKQLSYFPDDVSFGFRNQPMQVLYHIKYDDFEALVFQ